MVGQGIQRLTQCAIYATALLACSSADHNGLPPIAASGGDLETGGEPSAPRLDDPTTGGSAQTGGSSQARTGGSDANTGGRMPGDGGMDAMAAEPTACAELKKEYPSDSKTPYPGGTWTLPDPSYGMVVTPDVRITMDDGVQLVGDVAYPTVLNSGQRAVGDFPVLLTQNPYGAAFAAATGELFVTRGYIYASIDVRGTSRSTGEGGLFTPRQAKDGAALVQWAASLPGSNGDVGLHGCSQLGINQLETATLLPPDSPVKAMIPACGSGDFYRDTAFDNGIPTAVGFALAGPAATNGGDEVYYRDYWQARDRLARADAIAATGIPALFWSGWHEPGALGSLELYTALQNLSADRPASAPITAGDPVNGKYQVIVGDWSHAGGLDQGIQLQWYDTWIKGLDTGLPTDTNTPLHLYERGGTDRWLNARCYPLTETYTPLYLTQGGAMLSTAPDSGQSDTIDWVPPGQTSDVLEYASEVFERGSMLAGPSAARLHVSSTNTNVQLVVDLFDQAGDGTTVQVSHGSALASLRRTDPDRSWVDKNGLPSRPHLTLNEDQFITPGEPTTLEVPLWPTVWAFKPGHRLVVRISTQPKAEDCGELLGVPVGCNPTDPMRQSLAGGTYTLRLGGDAASMLSLPLLEYGALPSTKAVVSPTGAVEDPVANLLGFKEYPLPINW